MITTRYDKDDIDWVSEDNRKYALEILYGQTPFYILHGADLTTEDEDEKYLVNQEHKMLLFSSIEQMRSSILNYQILSFDPERLLLWTKSHKKTQPYSRFNFNEVRSVVNGTLKFTELNQEQTMEVVHFINLFGDYAYQRKEQDSSLLLLHSSKEVRTFFDFAYDNYVWDNPEHAGYRSLNELDFLRFDEENFRITVRQMIELFMANTVTWTSR